MVFEFIEKSDHAFYVLDDPNNINDERDRVLLFIYNKTLYICRGLFRYAPEYYFKNYDDAYNFFMSGINDDSYTFEDNNTYIKIYINNIPIYCFKRLSGLHDKLIKDIKIKYGILNDY